MYTAHPGVDSKLKCEIVIDRVPVHSDEHINYWANVWVEEKLKEEGILLESFLRFPHDLLGAVQRKRSREFRPLLPQQKQIRERVFRQDSNRQVALALNRFSSHSDVALGAEADVSHVLLQFNKGIRDDYRK